MNTDINIRGIMYAALLTLFMPILCLPSYAQVHVTEQRFSVDNNDRLELNLKFGDLITVQSWDKNEVFFEAETEINGGKLNEALEIDFSYDNGVVKFTSDFNRKLLEQGRRKDCPDNGHSIFGRNSGDEAGFICSEISYRIFIPATMDIEIETVSSSIELEGLSGSIRAKSISGFVDLSWPPAKSADIQIKTVSGEAYSNLDTLKLENKAKRGFVAGYQLTGKIGAGGHPIFLESVSGNIYLRATPF